MALGHSGHTVITDQPSARPSFEIPRFLLSRPMKRGARQTVERLPTEIAARSRRANEQQTPGPRAIR